MRETELNQEAVNREKAKARGGGEKESDLPSPPAARIIANGYFSFTFEYLFVTCDLACLLVPINTLTVNNTSISPTLTARLDSRYP